MNIKVKSGVLKEMLSNIEPIIVNNNIMEILKFVLMEVKDKKLKISGTNLEQSVEITTNAEIDGEFKVCLPFNKVNTIVKSFSDDKEIEIKKEGDTILLINGKNKYSFSSMDAEEFPTRQKEEYQKFFSLSGDDIKEVGKRFSYVIDQKEPRPHFTGMLIEVNEKSVNFVGTDAKQLLLDTYLAGQNATIYTSGKALIPYNSLKYLQHIDCVMVDFLIGKNSISVIHKKVVDEQEYDISFETQQLAGVEDYPDYTKVFPKEINATMTFNIKELKNAVSRFGVINGEFAQVDIAVKDNDFMLNSRQEDISIEEHITPIKSENEMSFRLPLKALNTIISLFSGITNEIQINFLQNDRPIAVLQESKPNMKYITMPLKQ